jgi:hypothetical protein
VLHESAPVQVQAGGAGGAGLDTVSVAVADADSAPEVPQSRPVAVAENPTVPAPETLYVQT